MGRAKLLLPYGGTTVVGAVAAALREAGADPIVVVSAPADTALQEWCRGAGLTIAVNPDPERGMLSTVREGVTALGGAAALARRGATLLVVPADLPALRAGTVRELLRRLAAARPAARLAIPLHGGRRGHPLAIAAPAIPEIERLDPGRGLNQLLEIHAGELLEVAVDDPGSVADIDTPADYERLRRGDGGE